MSNHLQAATMPEFFGKRYNSQALKIVSSAIIFIFLVPYTASIYNGLSRLFALAFDLPYWVCVLGMAVLTALYVTLGGYMATAINDLFQGIIMLVGIVAVVAAVLNGQGGFFAAVHSLAQFSSDIPVTLGQAGAFTSFFGPDPANLLGVIVLTSLGTWGLPQMVHKFYTIKSEKSVAAGTVISTVFAIVISGGCYFLGGFARLFDSPAIYNAQNKIMYDGVIPHMLSGLPDILIGLVVVLVLSASMSTLSSLVLTSSSTMTLDFLKAVFLKDMKEKNQVLIMRLLIVFFILLSVVFALKPPDFIAQLMGISWGALAGSFLGPFLYGLYGKWVTRKAVWVSFAAGIGITLANLFFPFINSPINAGAFAMAAGLILVPLVSLFTQNPYCSTINATFACYEEVVTVPRRVTLSDDGAVKKNPAKV
jgi:SSS family solute:Na+ symporter